MSLTTFRYFILALMAATAIEQCTRQGCKASPAAGKGASLLMKAFNAKKETVTISESDEEETVEATGSDLKYSPGDWKEACARWPDYDCRCMQASERSSGSGNNCYKRRSISNYASQSAAYCSDCDGGDTPTPSPTGSCRRRYCSSTPSPSCRRRYCSSPPPPSCRRRRWCTSPPTAAPIVTPPDCTIEGSNKQPGTACACLYTSGYDGSITYSSTDGTYTGSCAKVPCNVSGSTKDDGADCRCADGYEGNITWSNQRPVQPSGSCTPANCSIPKSNMKAGLECKCNEGYCGVISWNRSVASGNCEPVKCNVEGSNNEDGPGCKCRNAYIGTLVFQSSAACQAQGACNPAPCTIANSNGVPGTGCACKDGFAGDITWEGSEPAGPCVPAPCDEPATTKAPGPACKCKDGYEGIVTWSGATPTASCKKAKCDINNSDKKDGECKCLDGFAGQIKWFGANAIGTCEPASCDVNNSNGAAGSDCRCKDGFAGNITWSADKPLGQCTPAPCNVENSNKAAGLDCKCLDGYVGSITWNGRWPQGSCAAPAWPDDETRVTLDAYTCYEGRACADLLDDTVHDLVESDLHEKCNSNAACTGYDIQATEGGWKGGRLCKTNDYPGMSKRKQHKLCQKKGDKVVQEFAKLTHGKSSPN